MLVSREYKYLRTYCIGIILLMFITFWLTYELIYSLEEKLIERNHITITVTRDDKDFTVPSEI